MHLYLPQRDSVPFYLTPPMARSAIRTEELVLWQRTAAMLVLQVLEEIRLECAVPMAPGMGRPVFVQV